MSSESRPSESPRTNRLAEATSPYLLQHAHNPVDWYEWGDEALQRARDEDKPIFLSIGYAACHWCHVMAHESFESEAIAEILNTHFISIKVDREERPDLDDIYMKAVMALSGSGGWPMTVFLTPDLKPFFGGTYFPPNDMYGRRGFGSLLHALVDAWQNQREQIADQGEQLARYIQASGELAAGDALPDESNLDKLYEQLHQQFDGRYGGFGAAPKFPHSMDLMFLMRYHRRHNNDDALHMVNFSLLKMARGGMYDQVGGGFHRYSTDAEWLVPHFEKMLYDNALLSRTYLEAWQLTGDPFHRRIATEILDYIIREMTSPEGGFYSTTDADSEGEEGKFFVWTPEQIDAVLDDEEARIVKAFWDVSRTGNFEHGTSILNVPRDPDEVAETLGLSVDRLTAVIDRARPKLYRAREERVHPLLDDKILTSWNGLMIGSMAFGGAALDEPRYLDAACNAAEFVLDHLQKDGRLLRTWRNGNAHLNAYLDDYAFLASALIDLYEATFELDWLQESLRLTDRMLDLFGDEAGGGLYSTSHDHENLIARMKPSYDGAEPSGNSIAALTLLRLAELTGNNTYRERAESILKALRDFMEQAPMGASQMHSALDFLLGPSKEIVLAGDMAKPEARAAREVIWGHFLPNKVVAHAAGAEASTVMPPTGGKDPVDGKVTVYVCENFACKAPVTGDPELREALGVA